MLGPGLWHRFPFPGGVTGLYLLTESHLACHTYPEHALATFNLYCCRPRPRWPWEQRLAEVLGAARVLVRCLPRGVEPEGTERVRVGGEEATLVVWSPDYDGKGKAWVRFDDGRDAIIGGSRVERREG